jgi:hypothetical protein
MSPHLEPLRYILTLSFLLRLSPSVGLFACGLTTKLRPCYMHSPRHFPASHYSYDICWRVTWKLWSFSLCNIFYPHVTFSFFQSKYSLITWFLNSFSLYSCLSVRNQVLHPYTITGDIILILPFSDIRREDNSELNYCKRSPNLISHTFLTFIQIEPVPSVIVRYCYNTTLVRFPGSVKYDVQLCFAHDSSFLQKFSLYFLFFYLVTPRVTTSNFGLQTPHCILTMFSS